MGERRAWHEIDERAVEGSERGGRELGGVVASGTLATADLTSFTAVGLAAGEPPLLPRLLDEQLARTPDAPAIDDGTVVWRYRELFRHADDLARRLRTHGVGPGDLVGVCHGRTAGAVVAILGVLRAGAAYVPLDPALPDQRLAEMMRRAQLAFVVTDPDNRARVDGAMPIDALVIADPSSGDVAVDPPPLSLVDPQAPVAPQAADPAYVLFTSGTSGPPKGVMISHANLAWFLAWLRTELDHRDFAVAAATMSFSFDPSIIELFGPLTTGGRVHLLASPMELAELTAPVTLIAAVPSIAVEVARAKRLPPTLRALIMGGQELTAETARSLRAAAPTVRLFNTYGPTETTVMVTSHEITGALGDRVPIGEPVPGSYVVVLDEDGDLVAPGQPGELHIGGRQVGRCYLDEPGLTADRFVELEHPGYGRHRLYRSGDRVARTADGLVFLGRFDDQVKVRGFRVEPTEIELQMRRVPGVAAAVVRPVVRNGDMQLVGYYVPAGTSTGPSAGPGSTADTADPEDLGAAIRRALVDVLPAYAVPAGFVALDTIPLTANGKLDVAALPSWPPATGTDSRREHDAAPPMATDRAAADAEGGAFDAVEAQVIDAVRAVLGVDATLGPIALDDDVVDALGASSLALVRILARLEQTMRVHLPIGQVVRDTTIGGIAEVVRAGVAGSEPLNEAAAWRVDGTAAPVILFHTYLGGVLRYRRLLTTIPDEHPLYGIQALDLDRGTAARRSAITLESVADRACQQLLAVRPEGPYIVGGHSIGGLIAVEVAQRLRARGEIVEQVVLIDTLPRRGLIQYAWAELLLNLPDLVAASGRERWNRLRTALISRLPRAGSRRSAPRDRVDEVLDGAGHTSNRAVRRYRSGRYRGDVVLLRTFHGITMAALDPTLGWGRLVDGQLTIRDVPGQHGTVLDPDLIDAVGRRLRETLQRKTGS